MDPLPDAILGPPTPDQVLSQSEVESLLAQVAEEENSVLVHTVDHQTEKRARDSIQPYDFRHPVFLSPIELRRLRLRHEEFLRTLAARLSLYLRMEFTLQMSKLETVLYRKFTEGLANPTHLTLFKVEPLPGVCILEMHPRLGLTIVDRLLGGPAHSVNAEHDFTEIELALIEQAVQLIVTEWCNHWRPVKELRPVLLGYENNGRFLQTAPHDAIVLALSLEARIGDCLEVIQIGFPYFTLEPLIAALNQAVESSVGEPTKPATTKPRWNPHFDDIRIPVTAVWTDLELTARDIAALKVGDVLELPAACAEQVNVRFGEVPRFQGRLGTRGKKWAIELSQRLKK